MNGAVARAARTPRRRTWRAAQAQGGRAGGPEPQTETRVCAQAARVARGPRRGRGAANAGSPSRHTRRCRRRLPEECALQCAGAGTGPRALSRAPGSRWPSHRHKRPEWQGTGVAGNRSGRKGGCSRVDDGRGVALARQSRKTRRCWSDAVLIRSCLHSMIASKCPP